MFNRLCIKKDKNTYFRKKALIVCLIQICQTLKHIRSKHLIHRDIKSYNFLLNKKKGFIKLGYFGLSKILNNTLEKEKTFNDTSLLFTSRIN